ATARRSRRAAAGPHRDRTGPRSGRQHQQSHAAGLRRDERRRPVVRRADGAFTFGPSDADFARHTAGSRVTPRGRVARAGHRVLNVDAGCPSDVWGRTPTPLPYPRGLEPVLVRPAYTRNRARSRLALSSDSSRPQNPTRLARRSASARVGRLLPPAPPHHYAR